LEVDQLKTIAIRISSVEINMLIELENLNKKYGDFQAFLLPFALWEYVRLTARWG
jgi:hypothetical protein